MAAGLLLALGSLTGCRHAEPGAAGASTAWPATVGECPRVYLVYHGYPTDGSPLAAPSPPTTGWTDPRMQRDLARLEELGVDGLLLGLRAERLEDPVWGERVARFLNLVENRGATSGHRLEVILGFPTAADGGPAPAPDRVGRWLRAYRLDALSCLYREAGRTVVLVAGDGRLPGPPHPALTVRRLGPVDADWRWAPVADPRRLVPTPTTGRVWLYAGWRGPADPTTLTAAPVPWVLDRAEGRTLQAEIETALAHGARVLCISSWNDYVNGDFVEPNSLDGDAVFRRLRETIRQVRAGCATPPPPAHPERVSGPSTSITPETRQGGPPC